MAQKSILITGSSSGIGYDAAHFLKENGWNVFATCRKREDCDRLEAEGLRSPLLDLNDAASIQAALAEILTETDGTLDALYNNGAYGCAGLVEDLPTQMLREIFETNFFGWHELTRAVIPVMRAQGHGHIINCSSVLGFTPLKMRGAYVSTKYALEGFTDVLRLEMRNDPIHIVLVEPGPITSKIRENSIPHFERWINWEASASVQSYTKLRERLYQDTGPDQFELPARAVSEKLLKALNSDNPKPRYFVTFPTHFAAICRRILPFRMIDWLTAKG